MIQEYPINGVSAPAAAPQQDTKEVPSEPEGGVAVPTSPTGGEYLDCVKELVRDLEKFELDIEKALVYGRGSHTYHDVVQGVFRGELHFYPLEKSFVICSVSEHPQKKTYHVFLAGGDLEEILNFEAILMENGKQLGCSALTLSGRLGWSRVLEKQGWSTDLVFLSKEIE